jgi:hypothetical protein
MLRELQKVTVQKPGERKCRTNLVPWRANQQADACNLTLFPEEKQSLSVEIKTVLDDISMNPGKPCRPWCELATGMMYKTAWITGNQ